jgi:imidazolonepropionase-like amidohydrolase
VILNDTVQMRHVPPETRAEWTRIVASQKTGPEKGWSQRNRVARANIPLLRRAGVPLLAGTDVGGFGHVAGFALHDALEQLVATGLTPIEALRTATLNPARFLHLSDSLGTVEKGNLADLVLLDADPLTNIRNTRRIRAVVANGRLYDRKALNALLDASARVANPPVAASAK